MRELWDRIVHMVRVARLSLVDDTGVIQRVQLDQGPLSDGSTALVDGAMRVQEFGFTSNPPLKSDAVVLRLGGARTASLVVGTNHQPSRLRNLKPGDSAQYDERGACVWLTPAGLVIDGAGLPATIRNVGRLIVEGDLDVTGAIRSNVGGAAVTLGVHTHGGVQPGAGSTAVPNPG